MNTTDTRTIEPVVKRLHVRLPASEAFALFTRDIGRWWPLGSHSCSLDRSARLEFDGRAGGSMTERTADGKSHRWGTLLVWEPPNRFAMSWHPGLGEQEATHVEVRFAEEGDGCTMQLTHSGWEARGPSAAASRDRYDQGWAGVLGRFEDYLGAGS